MRSCVIANYALSPIRCNRLTSMSFTECKYDCCKYVKRSVEIWKNVQTKSEKYEASKWVCWFNKNRLDFVAVHRAHMCSHTLSAAAPFDCCHVHIFRIVVWLCHMCAHRWSIHERSRCSPIYGNGFSSNFTHFSASFFAFLWVVVCKETNKFLKISYSCDAYAESNIFSNEIKSFLFQFQINSHDCIWIHSKTVDFESVGSL